MAARVEEPAFVYCPLAYSSARAAWLLTHFFPSPTAVSGFAVDRLLLLSENYYSKGDLNRECYILTVVRFEQFTRKSMCTNEQNNTYRNTRFRVK